MKKVEEAGGFMGGGSQKFGFDEENLNEDFFEKVKKLKNIDLKGMHIFAATQIISTKDFLANIKNTCQVALKLNNFFEVKYIDFGGGLGIPYTSKEKNLELRKISKTINQELKKFHFLSENGTKLYMEPGRFLVGTGGIYVTRVNNVKISRGRKIVLVDGGIHHMMRPALMGSNHPVYNLSKIGERKVEKVDIGGSLCTSLDFFGKRCFASKNRSG